VFERAATLALLLALPGAVPQVAAETVLKDPTRPLRAPAQGSAPADPAGPRPRLNSVLFGADRRVAVIDGRRMTEGERHGALEVMTIHPDRVVVRQAGVGRLVLQLTNADMHKELR
jgi:MSHA biogenesis protein MshK